jgi:hypothetical protein
MEQITKEWPEEFLVLVVDAELSDTDTIGSPIVTWVEHVGQSSGTKKKKKQDEVQDIDSNEKENASEDNGSGSPGRGEDEVEGQGGGDARAEEKGGGEATTPPPKDPPVGTITPQKRKVSPKKPSARKKTRANKPQLEATLTKDDISLVHRAMVL